MSSTPTRAAWQRHKLTILGASAALIGGGIVAANFAGAAGGPSAVDYSQCSNGAPNTTPNPDCNWINGVLNANNSQYHEDEVTPQRLLVSFPDPVGGTRTHTLTLTYLDRKSTAHAYDYLASANVTVADALDLRCKTLPISEAACLALTHGARGAITPDSHELGGSAAGVSKVISDHMGAISADNRKMDIYGAEFVNPAAASTDPSHDCLAPCTGDDYATTTVSFTTPAGPGPHYVQLLFGGHLAAGLTASQQGSVDGWGENLGAGSISGGPYHIKWAGADGASVGKRDNQIMSGAIIEIVAQSTTVTSDATPNGDVVIGTSSLETVHDQGIVEVASSAHPPTGSAVISLYGPFTSAPSADADCVDPPALTANRLATFTVTTFTQEGATLFYDADMAVADYVDLTATTGFAAGKYYQWTVDYVPGSDQYNQAGSSDCTVGDERIHVTKAGATGASTQTITDTVTVSGFGTPAGSVSFFAYSSLTACTDDLGNSTGTGTVFSSTNRALTTGAATSAGYTPVAADGSDFWWRVYYNGDTNNAAGDVEGCGTQTFSIDNS